MLASGHQPNCITEGDVLDPARHGGDRAALHHVADEPRVRGAERARLPLHRHDQLRRPLLLPLHRHVGRQRPHARQRRQHALRRALRPHGAHLLQDARLVAPAPLRPRQRPHLRGRREDDLDDDKGQVLVNTVVIRARFV